MTTLTSAQASAAVGFTGVLVRICGVVYRLVLLHLLWVAGMLVGGVVLGIGPATAAAYLVAARDEGEDASARRTARAFIAAYRRGFARANAVALALALLVAVVVAATALLPHLFGVAVILTRAALLGAVLVAGITALGLGPALIRFGAPGRALGDLLPTLRTGFLYGVVRLPLTLVSALALAAVALAILQVPGLALALGPATVAALVVRLDAATRR